MTVFAWMGAICTVLMLLCVMLLVVGVVIDAWTRAYQNLCYKTEELTRRQVGTRLLHESWWYSEDEAVMSAIEIIGRKLSQDGYNDISSTREEWRNRKGKAK